jgi:hypothetical protein
MSNAPDWLLVVTGLNGGAIGAVVTTYGTQIKERRAARGTYWQPCPAPAKL